VQRRVKVTSNILGPTGPQVQVPDEFPEFLGPADRAEFEAFLDALDAERDAADAAAEAADARQAMEAEHAAALDQDAGEGEPW
jgi:hypothetical protein